MDITWVWASFLWFSTSLSLKILLGQFSDSARRSSELVLALVQETAATGLLSNGTSLFLPFDLFT